MQIRDVLQEPMSFSENLPSGRTEEVRRRLEKFWTVMVEIYGLGRWRAEHSSSPNERALSQLGRLTVEQLKMGIKTCREDANKKAELGYDPWPPTLQELVMRCVRPAKVEPCHVNRPRLDKPRVDVDQFNKLYRRAREDAEEATREEIERLRERYTATGTVA